LPELTAAQWLLGTVCAFLVGVAKMGVPGVGTLVVPLMVLAVGDARASAGWLLPILCTADVFAVVYWRGHAAAGRLFSLAPWVLAGMALAAVALRADERVLRPLIGSVVLVMLTVHLWRRYVMRGRAPAPHPIPYGVAAGFATTIANAAGPVMNLYLLSKRLTKEEFVAMGAWFFFVINLTKVPIYLWHGMITGRSLAFDGLMVPAVVAGAFSGRWIIHRIRADLFEVLVVAMTAVATAMLFR
jgi:uncharacterized membrane protein YfcA